MAERPFVVSRRAILKSSLLGSALTALPAFMEAQKTTERISAQLGLKATQVAALQQVPIAKLLAAMGGATAGGGNGVRFGPVVDGHSLPRDPFDPDAPEVSSDVPMIVGTTETEGSYFAPPDLLSLDEAAVRSRLEERLGNDGDRIYDMFRRNRPKATPSEIYFTGRRLKAAAACRRIASRFPSRCRTTGRSFRWGRRPVLVASGPPVGA